MPFRPTKSIFKTGKRKGQKVYKSPSGKKLSLKQVRAYYAKKGKK